MSNQLFKPVTVNGKTIHWKCISGRAVGVQKYTTTHVSGGGNSPVSSWIETIIELSIEQSNGRETQFTLCGDDIRPIRELSSQFESIQVREGQRVSAIRGYIGTKIVGKNSCWLIFVNHDYKTLYWLCTPQRFFQSLGMFPRFSVLIFLLIESVATLVFIRFSRDSDVSLFLMIALLIVIMIEVYVFQKIFIFLPWRAIYPQVVDMARQVG